MWFSAGTVPNYMVIKQLGLIDSHWSLILCTLLSAYNVIIMRGFFYGIPKSIVESAKIDGASSLRILFQIILPLSIPMMITIFLFSFSWQWTDEFYVQMFFTDTLNKTYLMPDVYQSVPTTLAKAISNFSGKTIYESVIKNTAGLMIIMPLVIVYLFCQRFLVQGIERSGLVG